VVEGLANAVMDRARDSLRRRGAERALSVDRQPVRSRRALTIQEAQNEYIFVEMV
jgi:hypothetical protein